MDKSANTEHSFGIAPDYDEKFTVLRHKAQIEEQERFRKAKKDTKLKLPKFKIGEKVVIISASGSYNKSPKYQLVEVLDIQQLGGWSREEYLYYGFVLKTTNPDDLPYIGRITHFNEGGWHWGKGPANVSDGPGIKWLDIKEKV